jgi:GrpB-like predicted nucleotidyltransferase (UPF0157 family)
MRHLVLALLLIGLLPIAASAASQDPTTVGASGEHHERGAAFREWLKDHPEAAGKLDGKKGDLSPEQRAERREKIKEWLKAHPEVREKLREKVRERRGDHGHEHPGHQPQAPAAPTAPATTGGA